MYSLDDFQMGRKIATGGFGEVYRASLIDPDSGDQTECILKRAKEFGEAEVWMNERLMRACPDAIAEFVSAFDETGRWGRHAALAGRCLANAEPPSARNAQDRRPAVACLEV